MAELVLVLVCKRPALGIPSNGWPRAWGRKGPAALRKHCSPVPWRMLANGRVRWSSRRRTPPIMPGPLPYYPSYSEKLHVVPQTDGNLGQRLNAVDHSLRERGLEHLIYIGSDAPALAAGDYAAARAALLNHDIVLKPAADGGVVLMGSRRVGRCWTHCRGAHRTWGRRWPTAAGRRDSLLPCLRIVSTWMKSRISFI